MLATSPSRSGACLPPTIAQGDVALTGVTFRYDGADRDALAQIDLELPAGKQVAPPGRARRPWPNAARAAQVHDLIEALPDGYDTLVGARGHRFSGGEQQRIALARTILRDPAVLVLDGATSALDNATERAVQDALDEVSRGRTTLTIAHRLSTVQDADLIVVLDGGRIAEQGTHDDLLARGGRYATLWNSQSARHAGVLH